MKQRSSIYVWNSAGLIAFQVCITAVILIFFYTFTSHAYGQSDVLNEIGEDKDQQDKEKFLELGEEKFREDCYKSLNMDNKIAEDLLGYMPKDFVKDACESRISKFKNETATLDQNQTLDSVTAETTYRTHNDNSKAFSVEYPTDWHVSQDGQNIFKGTREFKISTYDDPKYSVLDTNSFGNIIFDIHKDDDGVKITDNLGQLNIGDEPASAFSYSQLGKEFMVVALMHNNVGYVFEYGTLRENSDKDFDTKMHFFGTIRFS
jgi:hypothetical protein